MNEQEHNDESNRLRMMGIAQGIILIFIYLPLTLLVCAACLFGLWCIWELEPTALLVPAAMIVFFIFICTKTQKSK